MYKKIQSQFSAIELVSNAKNVSDLQQSVQKRVLDLEMSFFESIQYCQKCVSFATEWAQNWYRKRSRSTRAPAPSAPPPLAPRARIKNYIAHYNAPILLLILIFLLVLICW